MYIKSTMESTYPHKYRNQQVRSRLKEEIILFYTTEITSVKMWQRKQFLFMVATIL